jgi:hypothetical protein
MCPSWCASTLTASPLGLQVGNNKAGVTGVGWRAQILACKALDAQGWGLISQVVECIDWCR